MLMIKYNKQHYSTVTLVLPMSTVVPAGVVQRVANSTGAVIRDQLNDSY